MTWKNNTNLTTKNTQLLFRLLPMYLMFTSSKFETLNNKIVKTFTLYFQRIENLHSHNLHLNNFLCLQASPFHSKNILVFFRLLTYKFIFLKLLNPNYQQKIILEGIQLQTQIRWLSLKLLTFTTVLPIID